MPPLPGARHLEDTTRRTAIEQMPSGPSQAASEIWRAPSGDRTRASVGRARRDLVRFLRSRVGLRSLRRRTSARTACRRQLGIVKPRARAAPAGRAR